MEQRNDQVLSRRDFPRIRESLAVRFEFVRWTETDPRVQADGIATTASDLSASGLGLSQVPTLDQTLVRQLLSGQKKARLAIELANGTTVHVFGRLIWTGLGEGSLSPAAAARAGFCFLDISSQSFWILKNYVSSRLAEQSENPPESVGAEVS